MTCPSATAVRKIELTQGKVALVDEVDYEYLMRWNWYAVRYRKLFRAKTNLHRRPNRTTCFMHTIIARRMGIDTKPIDHRDHDSLNNCRYNLRPATFSQNGHNQGTYTSNKSGIKGVYQRRSGRYRAYITVENKRHSLGTFDTIDEAEKIVIAKRKELVGEFACNDRRTV